MANDYSVNPIIYDRYDLFCIKLSNGTKGKYWKNKGSNNINDVIVIMNADDLIVDNKNISNIRNNQVGIDLSGVNKVSDIRNMVISLSCELNKIGVNIRDVRFSFMVASKEDEKKVQEVVSGLRINYDIIKSDKYKHEEVNKEEIVSGISNELDARGDVKQISKHDAGLKNYTVVGNKIYDDNSNLRLAEQKQILLAEWMNDSTMLQEISNLSKEALDKRLTEAVTVGLKGHYMDKPSFISDKENNKNGNVLEDEVRKNGGEFNSELGIARNDVSNSNEFSVEEDGRIVNPSVSSYTIGSNGVASLSDSSYNLNASSVDVNIYEEKTRKVESEVYYIGSSSEIYDKSGKIIGKVGVDGYAIDENNNLIRGGKVIGVIGDINDMGVDKTVSKNNVRVLKKPERPSYDVSDKSAAFISLPVIVFIVSLILLIGSGIILFVMK